jgi:competence protein ComEA
MARLGRGWTVIIIVLVLAILAGGAVYLNRRGDNHAPLEIVLSSSPTPTVKVYIDGAVNDPGLYNLPGNTTLAQLPQIFGGLKEGADYRRIEISVPESEQTTSAEAQKVNLNTAPDWMLEALPGVGPTLAQNIIDYRKQHPFKRISELMQVEGIGPTTYENLKDFITVE